jgi:hypothetical protein
VAQLIDGEALTQGGTAQQKVRLEVLDGPEKGNGFIHTFYLSAAKTEYDQDSGERVARTDAEYEKKLSGAMGRMRGFIKTLDIDTNEACGDDEDSKYHQFFNVQMWVGREFMGEVALKKNNWNGEEENSLQNYFPNDHKEHGIDMWRQKELPKQLARAGKGSVSAGAGAATAL